ncbi:PREDICTED: testin [Diuraphis noxia]|uniref:testin n=1 Tax=Diuraphis noxia TaxID=143948 RepID=UPI00076366B8|nr:PREDICTED: testin [Diuraphis noxia]
MALEPEEHFKTPEWVSRLENKHKKFHKLAHEVGSGSSCLKCGDACPGLDLHFWRKVCRNCKCKREEHNIVDEDQYKQLDILFNDSKSNYQPIKAVLNMIIKPDDQFAKKRETDQNQNQNEFKFDWVPPNVHKDLASEYMQLLPSDKLPISGSEGAFYRRKQLEKQVPLHDFNANACHDLTIEEADAMGSYLKNLKENAVGQGLVKKLTDNTNNPIPLFKNMNLTPKPFKKTYDQQVEEEFPPPPPELLYPLSNSELKTPSTFIGNKSYSATNKPDVNILDTVNNNPAECNRQIISSQWPTSNIAKSETLPQQQTNFSSNIQNDNFTPKLHDKHTSETLKNPLLERSNEFPTFNADKCILSDGQELRCKQCNKNVIPGQVAVMAERTGKEVFWHPSCFVCATCEELLVDLVYFYFNGNVYCGRHYAEILNIPRCNACDELIFLKEYTIAEEHTYHVRHFCCFECDKPLAGLEYVSIEKQPVCLDCYQTKYGKKCETCQNIIVAGENRIGWQELSWHESPACFKCYQCYTSLLGKKFTVKKEKRPLCSKECVIAFNNSTEL